eukprot:4873978-Amphidinium_carterae.1
MLIKCGQTGWFPEQLDALVSWQSVSGFASTDQPTFARLDQPSGNSCFRGFLGNYVAETAVSLPSFWEDPAKQGILPMQP